MNLRIIYSLYKDIPKKVAAQPPGCSRVKVQLGKFRRAAEKTKQRKHREEEIQKAKKELSHRDAFRPCSRVSSGGRTNRETNWKTGVEGKDRFNQQQGT